MKRLWEVDAGVSVEANFGSFGKEIVTGRKRVEVLNQRRMRSKGALAFALPDGRAATIQVTPEIIGQPNVDLRIAGRLLVPTTKFTPHCPSCSANVRPNDRFCDGCGKPLPTGEERKHEAQLKRATGAIGSLAVLFAISGAIMFFISKSQTSDALKSLANLDANASVPIQGVTHTVAELRTTLIWEPWGILITNLVLALAMFGLATWAKRAPLPAVLVAAATYMVVIVTNAAVDPKTIAQGIFVKIVVIAFFVKGIKAALSLRAARATAT